MPGKSQRQNIILLIMYTASMKITLQKDGFEKIIWNKNFNCQQCVENWVNLDQNKLYETQDKFQIKCTLKLHYNLTMNFVDSNYVHIHYRL